MYLRSIVGCVILFTAQTVSAQISITKGMNLSVDVASDGRPGADFTPIDGDLEDVYFATLKANGIDNDA